MMRTSLVKTRRDGNRDDCAFPVICGDSCQHCQDSAGFLSEFLRARAYSAFGSLPQFEKTLQEFGRCKQAESPARKTPDENRRQVRRPKGKLGRGVTGLRSKRLGRAPCACRNKLSTCQIIGSFHQIEEPNKEEKRVRLMAHSVDLGLRFGAKRERPAKRAQAIFA